MTQKQAALIGLVALWREQQAAYPMSPEGQHAAAAVRCCANELEDVLRGSPLYVNTEITDTSGNVIDGP